MVEVLRHAATILGVWRHSILGGRRKVRGWILSVAASAVVILIGLRKAVRPIEVAGKTTVIAVVVEIAGIVAIIEVVATVVIIIV